MKKKFIAALAAAALAVIPATAALADGHEAEVVVVHGVPLSVFESLGADSTKVDIIINGETSALTDVEYGTTAVVPIDAGTYDLAVALPGTTDPITPELEISGATLAAGDSVSIVAHLNTDGAPLLGAYGNLNDATGIQVFHLANFGPVDVFAGETVVLPGAANGVTARVDVDGGTTVEAVGVGVAESGEVAIPLGDVEVPADTLVLVYAVGPGADATPDFYIETVSVPSADTDTEEEVEEETEDEAEDEVAHPTEVDSGTGGLLDAGLPIWVAALMVLGALGIAAPAVAASRRS